jgi:hypothetical protein
MKTIMFIETQQDSGKHVVGFQLCNFNYFRAPKGIIRIARFMNGFDPMNNRGYYADTYFKIFIRKCKRFIQRKRERRKAINALVYLNIPLDIKHHILNFL